MSEPKTALDYERRSDALFAMYPFFSDWEVEGRVKVAILDKLLSRIPADSAAQIERLKAERDELLKRLQLAVGTLEFYAQERECDGDARQWSLGYSKARATLAKIGEQR